MKKISDNEVFEQNQKAWNKCVEDGNRWTIPVSAEIIEKAKQGEFNLVLTPKKFVPRDWFPKNLKGQKILCLASGGGQQAPVLAAAGADVTVFDLSQEQLKKDKFVADRDNLKLSVIQGNMYDLSVFPDEFFDIVFNPVSMCFIPDVNPVFKEVYRVLKKQGRFLFGIANPFIYLFNTKDIEKSVYIVKNKLPFMSFDELSGAEIEAFKNSKNPIEYSHTLADIIGGQIKAGFEINGFYEDTYDERLAEFSDMFFATKAVKR